MNSLLQNLKSTSKNIKSTIKNIMFIRYNEYDTQNYKNYTDILEFLGGREVKDQDVWKIARKHEEIPIFENILYYKTLSDIKFRSKKLHDIDIDYYINSVDTHLYIKINNEWEEILELSEFKDAIKTIKAKLQENE
jgi:hypothetical protein